MVRHHKPAVDPAPAPGASQQHPAAGKCIGISAKALHPRGARRRRRGQHQRLADHCGRQAIADQQRRRQRHPGVPVNLVQRLHSAMHDERANAGVHPAEQPLRLAERITKQHRRAPGSGVGAPPLVDVRKQLRLRGPAVERQTKGGFGDKGVATHRLERRAGTVGLYLVVARGDPNLALVLHAHLRRTQHMPGGMQRHGHPVAQQLFAVRQGLQVDARAQAAAQRAFAGVVRQVAHMPHACMVRMPVGDDGVFNRSPRVNIKVPCSAIKAFRASNDQVGSGHRQRHQKDIKKALGKCQGLFSIAANQQLPCRTVTWRGGICAALQFARP